jgi:hypothetical protein
MTTNERVKHKAFESGNQVSAPDGLLENYVT